LAQSDRRHGGHPIRDHHDHTLEVFSELDGLTRFLAPLLPPPLLVATTVDVTHSIDMLRNASYAVTSWLSASTDVTDS
jgi:hypothetical protein